MIVDIYSILPEEFFEQIGDFSNNEEEFAPIDYEDVCISMYSGNSFYGPEFVDLLVDHEEKVFYIRSAIRQPVGDYAWTTIWAWYRSMPERYEEICTAIEKALKEDAE